MNDFLREFKGELQACMQNEPPFCAAACPFHLDVKDFIEKLRRGGFNGAFRLYQNTVGFPAIVAAICDQPCQKHCSRVAKGGAIELRELERAALQYARSLAPNSYNLPAKRKSLAVVGAGISGLACALRLASRNYQVTVFEQSERIGGHLWHILAPDIFLTDIECQFQHCEYELKLGQAVSDLAELSGFDAVYLATGRDGAAFGLAPSGAGAHASTRAGVFTGGSLLDRTTMEALADGLFAANAVERYLKTGNMNEPQPPHDTKIKMDLRAVTEEPAVQAAAAAGYSRAEAQSEAQRCLQCSCNACLHTCDLMRITGKFPHRIWEEVQITIHPGTLDKDGTWATRLIATCNQCGLCKNTCPQRIDLGAFLRQSHRAMHNKGAMPWAFHDFWLRDLAFTNGPEAQLCRAPKGQEQCRYLFFPGCQLGAARPEYVTESYRWLCEREPETGLLLNCCGAPAHWVGDEALMAAETARIRAHWQTLGEPTVIYACPTCREMFRLYLPELELVSLYELLAQSGLAPAANVGTVSVFDPCNSRDCPEMQEAVRTLALRGGATLDPLPLERQLAQCCSYGGQIAIAAPHYAERVVRERAAQKDHPYIAYCINCRDNFISARKPVYHILDLALGLEPQQELPTLSARRANRVELKRQLLADYWQETPPPKAPGPRLQISAALQQKLNQARILESEIAQVVRHCEQSGRKIYQPETDSFAGHLKIGHMTYWAVYRPEADGYLLLNAYAHRMNLAGE